MEQITIAGHSFNVPVRYEEGHELTAGEASALNQTYHENLRNNFAKKVKDAAEANGGSPDLASLQAELDTYANDYQFGVRTGGGGISRDPVMSEAMRIAKKQIGDLIRAKGGKVTDYEPAAITNAAKGLLAKPQGAQIMEVARARVEEQKNLAAGDLGDLLSGMTAKAPEPAPAAPTEGQAA